MGAVTSAAGWKRFLKYSGRIRAIAIDTSDVLLFRGSSGRTVLHELFKKKAFSQAYTKYSEAIEHDDRNAILYCNRAACALSLNRCGSLYSDTVLISSSTTQHRYMDACADAKKVGSVTCRIVVEHSRQNLQLRIGYRTRPRICEGMGTPGNGTGGESRYHYIVRTIRTC